MSKSSGHEIFISAAFFNTLATVFLDTPQLCAMFRSLNPKFCKRRISRYLVIIVTSFTCIHTNGVYLQYKGNICNRAFKCGSELPEYVALILRNGGSQSPDRWLREPRNNQRSASRIIPIYNPNSNAHNHNPFIFLKSLINNLQINRLKKYQKIYLGRKTFTKNVFSVHMT